MHECYLCVKKDIRSLSFGILYKNKIVYHVALKLSKHMFGPTAW